MGLAATLVVVASSTAVAMTAAASDEQVRAEQAAAAATERKLVDFYTKALEQLEPVGAQLADDATGWAKSGSPLLTTVDVTSLQSTADAVSGFFAQGTPPHATSEQLSESLHAHWLMISGARERFDGFVAAVSAVAKTHLDAAPIADAATRQALADAIAALQAAARDHTSVLAPFATLTTAVAAVDASQAAAVAAQAAAAAAAAAAAKSHRGSVTPRAGSAAASGSPAPVCSSDVLTCVNQIRAYYGFGALSSNGTLNNAAQACADRMAASNSMTHSSPTPGFGYWGENIAHGYGSQASVFNAWMNSAGHRANILNSHYRYMGLGYASGNWWCQQFGS
jgi:uncharacterized protein YkwD